MNIEENNVTPAQSAGQNLLRILALVLGDMLVFLIFSVVGRNNHGEAAGLSATLEIVKTASPFATGWFLVAPFVGAYKHGLEYMPSHMVRRTLLAWACSWPLGMVLRCLIKWEIPNYTFFIVSFVSIAIILLVWRWPFALYSRARQRRSHAAKQDSSTA